MERCPVCRARYKGSSVCRRCRADLSPLLDIETSADRCASQAVQALVSGDRHRAEKEAVKARSFQGTLFNSVLVGFIRNMKG